MQRFRRAQARTRRETEKKRERKRERDEKVGAGRYRAFLPLATLFAVAGQTTGGNGGVHSVRDLGGVLVAAAAAAATTTTTMTMATVGIAGGERETGMASGGDQGGDLATDWRARTCTGLDRRESRQSGAHLPSADSAFLETTTLGRAKRYKSRRRRRRRRSRCILRSRTYLSRTGAPARSTFRDLARLIFRFLFISHSSFALLLFCRFLHAKRCFLSEHFVKV